MPFIGNIGPTELIIVLVIALLVLGPGKLPEVGSALGKSIREFRRAATDVKEAASLDPIPPAPPKPNVLSAPAPARTPDAPPTDTASGSGPETPAS
ncbi:MAG: twin-arginine translocase TatA/TatE family subunit [Chloroflexi bacterium]|nr:twin-arginine translocase TatA/TatE family subunit [Chloroflexota bacterium]